MFKRITAFKEGQNCTPKLRVRVLKFLILSIITLLFPINTFAQVPSLGVLVNFSLFTTNGALTNTATSSISGSVGAHIGAVSGFGAPTTVASIESANALTLQGTFDVQSAYDQIFGFPQTVFGHPPAFGAGETVFPGVYAEAGAGSVSLNLTLDGLGDPNAVFIFKFGEESIRITD